VQSAIKDLLDEVDEKGWMDVIRDFTTPLPALVIAQISGAIERLPPLRSQ
jgi:hypothetical protein